jgi:hypothetical protein
MIQVTRKTLAWVIPVALLMVLAIILPCVLLLPRRKNIFAQIPAPLSHQGQVPLSLAFYTCFYGDSANPAFVIPQAPSKTYACYYFTNNATLAKEIVETTSWICVYSDKPAMSKDQNKSCMASKRVKVLPHTFAELTPYKYTCYLDSKLAKVSETFVEQMIQTYMVEENYAMLLRQHWFIRNSVWDEFKESMKQARYRKERSQYKTYITSQIAKGLADTTSYHCACGFIIRNMHHAATRKIDTMWFEHIQACGIQDQISFFFVKQYFDKYIKAFTESPFV